MGKRMALERELQWGTFVQDYFQKEKHEYQKRIAPIIEKNKNFEQNNKSEFQKDMVIDSRVYMRWLREDPDFWKDATNVKKFKKDNPECQPWKR